MPILMFFNELSLTPVCWDVREAQDRAVTLTYAISSAVSRGARRELRVPAGFSTHPLATNYSWAQWLSDGRSDHEARRYARALATRSPFLAELPDAEQRGAGAEIRFAGQTAAGISAAYLADGIALSLPSAPTWDTHLLRVGVSELDDDSGDLREHADQQAHGSDPRHIEQLRDWFQSRLQRDVVSGVDLWDRRVEILPRLTFCAAVKDQLRDLPANAHSSCIRGLLYLNEYVNQWHTGAFNCDAMQGAVSPESATTLRDYGAERTFRGPDGVSRVFSWHVKVGGWRVHFHPDNSTRSMLVGYVGKHLRTARFN